MKKPRTERDEEIRGKIAQALEKGLKKSGKSREEVAELLQIELGTLYKYLAASMIPGGHVLWRACKELGMVLDDKGLRLIRRTAHKPSPLVASSDQYELPFVNESVAGDKVHLSIGKSKKDSRSVEYVHVSLRIKVAG